MVSKTEEEHVNRLESQVENGGGGEWEYLCLVRKLKLRRSFNVLKYGLSILNNPKKRSALGPEEWTLYEQVAVTAMDCQHLDLAKDYIKVLAEKFPESKRVGRLEALLLEAKGLYEEAEKAYSSLLEDNELDPVIHKRRVALAKAQGNISGAIELLNKYLEIFMADHDAWRELAEIYVSLQIFRSGKLLELLIVLYTFGGVENLHMAKKYYASTTDLTGGKNTRALFGLCLCTSAIEQLTKGRNKDDKENSQLASLSATALGKDYEQRAPNKVSLLASTLKSLKLSS
ncbi:ER membrane protein complex subunit 2-like [Olea europaea var. sylvestris]|uniref:ER membrane protein complex subunit 2-like n=1 Tax=Olea europaea var. sylvestris TaxID=158386 RepID=UPI000C1D3831|nr:ER membrane protein complex subunit 2-like [Olea europaea var. sylvestris]